MGYRLFWGYTPLLTGNFLCRANQMLLRIDFQGADKLENPLHVCRTSPDTLNRMLRLNHDTLKVRLMATLNFLKFML